MASMQELASKILDESVGSAALAEGKSMPTKAAFLAYMKKTGNTLNATDWWGEVTNWKVDITHAQADEVERLFREMEREGKVSVRSSGHGDAPLYTFKAGVSEAAVDPKIKKLAPSAEIVSDSGGSNPVRVFKMAKHDLAAFARAYPDAKVVADSGGSNPIVKVRVGGAAEDDREGSSMNTESKGLAGLRALAEEVGLGEKKKGYKQLELKDLLAVLPKEKLQKMKDSDAAYAALVSAESKLIKDLLKTYDEVGEVDPTRMSDYCDSLWYGGK